MVDSNTGVTIEDDELVDKAKRGDEFAFETLVKKYQQGIYRLTYRMTNDHFTADELSLETFIRAYKAIGRFRKGANFFNWVYTIAMHLCLNYIKREKRKVNIDPENINVIASRKKHNNGLLKGVLAKEMNVKIMESIQNLPEKLRVVFLLRVDEDLSYDEISKTLRIPTGTVMSRLNRARERLKESIGKYIMSK
ncbi:sigma-70 family RNA polymerase sigma factor [candidate division WOR-3 bacterium]|nr:sigma-70 family RNA polymerase sigma factor [candidate division WOR-3 bacterium]